MKIGIITVYNGQNYGASLQAFALVQTLRRLGHEAYLIGYCNEKIEKRLASYSQISSWHSIASIGRNIRMIVSRAVFHTDQYLLQKRERFDKFHALILDSDYGIVGSEALPLLNDKYDGFICGSDQIWNKDITDLDDAFFLQFAADGKCTIAYAPSLGMASDKVDQEMAADMRLKLKKIRHLSVREANNRELIETLTGRACHVTADPVLLFTKEDWLYAIAQAKAVCPAGKYAFYYPVVDHPKLQAFAIREAKKLGIDLLNPRLIPGYAKIRGFRAFPQSVVGPLEFLALLVNSEVVYTNSFHATVFSSMFKKNLYTMQMHHANENRNNRIIQYLLSLKAIDDLEINNETLFVSSQRFSLSDEIRQDLRLNSVSFLKKALAAR